MLELGRYPACVLPCHTTLAQDPAQRSMSDRKYSGSSRDAAKTERRDRSKPMRDHRHARSSAEDPTISSTRSSKSVSSNARNHPRAELRDSDTLRQHQEGSSGGRQSQGSPAVNHVSSSKSNGGRKRVCEEEEEEESVWVEHTSSSGRIYYYNKKNGVSQWERPPSMAKRTKTDDQQSKPKSSSSGSKHSSHSHSSPSHSHSSHSSHPHSQHTSSSHSSHSHSHGHRGYSSSSAHHSSHHSSHSSQGHHDRVRERERDRSHGSHRRSNRGSRSSSKSASVSPTTSGRGRSHHDKATPNRHSSRSHGGGTKRGSVSPNVSASGRQSSAAAVAVSPCTPGLPHGISQSLVATQQVINQTSAIIKHQQKLLSASGDPATTTSPPSSSKHTSSLTHSHARQKLVFHAATSTASTPMQANGPLTQELAMGGASTPATPLQNSVAPTASAVEMSPQMTGLENLHPLQRALLLQQQQQQQQQECLSEIPVRQSTPGTPLPSSGGGGATPLSQSVQVVTPPISALPPHLASQVSHPGSPYSNSPNHTPSLTTPPPGVHLVPHPMVPGPFTPVGLPPSNSQTPVYHQYSVPMVMPPNTPIPGIYMADGGMVQTAAAAVGVAPGGGAAYMTPATPVVPLRPPMSRLGHRRSSGTDEFALFPDPGQVELVVSKTSSELFSRSLAESWWSPATETLQKQLDTSQRDMLSRRTTEALYLHGRLRRSQLSLDSIRLRTNTRRERLLALEHLVTEIDQR